MVDAFVDFEDTRRWLTWRGIERNGKLTKTPCDSDGNPIDGTAPANWLTRLEAEGQIRELAATGVTAGLGLALGDLGDGTWICGTDLDASLDRGGIPFLMTQEIRERLLTLGYADDAIRNLTPQQANEIVAARPPRPLGGPDPRRTADLRRG
jgi:hypothetical protein